MNERIIINAKQMIIDVSRWGVRITVVYSSGNKSSWIVSADHDYTEGDGIYFASEEEHEKFLKERW